MSAAAALTSCCVRIDFRLQIPAADYVDHCRVLLDAFGEVPGLCWKLWLLDEASGRAGGVYLFEDEASAHRYLDGPIVAALRRNPAMTDVVASMMPLSMELSRATGGPALRTG